MNKLPLLKSLLSFAFSLAQLSAYIHGNAVKQSFKKHTSPPITSSFCVQMIA